MIRGVRKSPVEKLQDQLNEVRESIKQYENCLVTLKEKEKTLAFENENVNDPYLLHINGLDEPLYIDGLYIKMINKLNKWFPKNSSKREKMKRVVKHFVH